MIKDKFLVLHNFFLKYLFLNKSFSKISYNSLFFMIEKIWLLLFSKFINLSFFKLSENISIFFNFQRSFSILIISLLKKSELLFEIPIVLEWFKFKSFYLCVLTIYFTLNSIVIDWLTYACCCLCPCHSIFLIQEVQSLQVEL